MQPRLLAFLTGAVQPRLLAFDLFDQLSGLDSPLNLFDDVHNASRLLFGLRSSSTVSSLPVNHHLMHLCFQLLLLGLT